VPANTIENSRKTPSCCATPFSHAVVWFGFGDATHPSVESK